MMPTGCKKVVEIDQRFTFHRFRYDREDGFTLKEVVITVAIILIISLVGYLSYQGFTENAKRSAVERAANEVFTAAVSEDMLPQGRSMQEVEDNFNETSDDHIRVEVEKDEATRDITVTAFGWEDEDPPYIAVRSTDITLDGSEGTPGDSEDGAEEIKEEENSEDINDFSDGVFEFTTEKEDSNLYMTGLSDNFTVETETGETYDLQRLGIDKNGGLVTFYGSGEFTVRGGFESTSTDGALEKFYLDEFGYTSEELMQLPNYEEIVQEKYADPGFLDRYLAVVSDLNMVAGNSPFMEPSSVTKWENTGTRDISRLFSSTKAESIMSPPSTITNMSDLFSYSSFNGDISDWDVSNVTNMSGMFSGAQSFNQDISDWDISNVTDMSNMFFEAIAFNNGDAPGESNNPLDWEDTSHVEFMNGMFWNADNFNQDISSWDVSNVTDMSWMFWLAESFNQDISSWDVSNVTDMSRMFDRALKFDNGGKPLDWKDTSSVTDMSYMFYGAREFNQNISHWDVSNVIDMTNMFSGARAFNNGDIAGESNAVLNWDTSSVNNMTLMFNLAESFNQDISNWTVPNIASKPASFDRLSHPDFRNNTTKHPQWGAS